MADQPHTPDAITPDCRPINPDRPEPPPPLGDVAEPDGDIWFFAYGSLMWDRGQIPHTAALPARLWGYHRALCIMSYFYRGTEAQPGLVLGLDRGGSTRGIAFRIAAQGKAQVMADLKARETSVNEYHLRWLRVRIETDASDGEKKASRKVIAGAYVINRDGRHYAGKLSFDDKVRMVAQGHGDRGACLDYLCNTVAHLQEMGIKERELERVLAGFVYDPEPPNVY
ncbi:MAG: gamma-glutamylcyclotransferase [Rhodospirillaceae bacterium]